VNYAGVLEELTGAPIVHGDAQEWKWGPLCDGGTATLIDTILAEHDGEDWTELDAISEAAEFCARMVEIERCKHERVATWYFLPTEPANTCTVTCAHCSAEYRTCSDGVARWV